MESKLGSEERQAELAGIRASLAEAASPTNVSGKALKIAVDTGHAECIKLLLQDTAPEYARSMETAMGSAQAANLAEMMRWAGGEEIQGSGALSAQNENGARQGGRGASFWAERTEAEREVGEQRIVDDVLRNARAGRAKPATADLESAVLAKDLASTIAWVASGKRWASKINVFSKRAAEAEHAMSLAAAMGWTEGLRVAGSFDMGSFGAWSRSKRLVNDEGREMWVPMAANTRHGEMKGWREDGEDRENRELSAMGFAAINKNVDALKFMTRRFRVVAEKIGPIQNGPIPAGWVFRKANKGAVGGPYAGMENAILFSIMAGDMGSAKALAMAGAGSPGLGEELAWAAKHSLPDVATMFVEVDPQSKALKGAIGQNLLSLSIDKGSAGLARMLLDLGVDSSKFMIHGMSLTAVLSLSKAECLAAVAAGGEEMGERARRSLLAFARAAESRKALPAPMASRSEDLSQKNNENNGGELASKGSSEESVAAGEEGLLPESSQARKAKESMGGDNGYAVSEAMRELERFEAVAGQMGGRIRALIAGLQDGAQDAFSEPPKTIGATVRKMRERAEAASQAIAKASSTQGARREP